MKKTNWRYTSSWTKKRTKKGARSPKKKSKEEDHPPQVVSKRSSLSLRSTSMKRIQSFRGKGSDETDKEKDEKRGELQHRTISTVLPQSIPPQNLYASAPSLGPAPSILPPNSSTSNSLPQFKSKTLKKVGLVGFLSGIQAPPEEKPAITPRIGPIFGQPLEKTMERQHKALMEMGEDNGEATVDHAISKLRDVKVPLFFYYAMQHLLLFGLADEGIFRLSGLAGKIAQLKESVDKGEEFKLSRDADVHCVSGLCKLYIRELPSPLLTLELYKEFVSVFEMDEAEKINKLKELLSKLPTYNYGMIKYIMNFLYHVSINSPVNMMTSSNLGVVVGPNILWTTGDCFTDSNKVAGVTGDLIVNYFSLFEEEEKITTPYCRAKLIGHKKSLVAMKKIGNEMWTSDANGYFVIYDTETVRYIGSMDIQQKYVFCLEAFDDYLCSGSYDSLRIIKVSERKVIKDYAGACYSLALVGNSIWASTNGIILIIDTHTLEIRESVALPDHGVWRMIYIPEKHQIWASSEKKNFVYIWDTKHKKVIRELQVQGLKKRIHQFSRHKNQIWCFSEDTNILVWDIETYSELKIIETTAKVTSVSFFGEFPVAGFHWVTQVKGYSTTTFENIFHLENYHRDAITTIESFVTQSGQRVCWTGSQDKSVCVWILPSTFIPPS
eukprot:TRINITY_DN3017_c0_g2_i1.p1 TRINITY_DN3017_c0_g2~~TRINITY_DN3017_c0_g2_i1.p1  ORF type:complete len:666 (-),score=109.39 TRINITY_DN3017_c0_g2_i1:101-2098(-)